MRINGVVNGGHKCCVHLVQTIENYFSLFFNLPCCVCKVGLKKTVIVRHFTRWCVTVRRLKTSGQDFTSYIKHHW